MRYLRRWDLPTFEEPLIEHLEAIDGWGLSYFWFCIRCRAIYANVMLSAEDCLPRLWRSIDGLCLTCAPDRWKIRGTLECIAFIGWHVPIEVALYQLDREIDFLCHSDHPHNKETAE